MGGRMSGESPRVEKLAMRHRGISSERPNQATDDGVVTGTAITDAQASGQQFAVCEPPRQQCLCDME